MEPRDVDHRPNLEPRWLDVDAASRYLCMSVDGLYHRVARRQIPFVKQGRIIRFDRFALGRWMAKGVRNGFDETRRSLVLQENDQRAAVRGVNRLRRQEVGRTSRLGHRARHPRRNPRLEEQHSEFRGVVGDLQEDLHADEILTQPRREHRAHFLPHFGARPLDEITKSDLVRYLSFRRAQMTASPGHKKRRQISESTVRRERSLLQAIFERAIEEGHDFRNPFRGIKRGKDKPRTRVLSLDEETKLMDALHPRFQRFVRFALGTGARLEEIRGVDPDRDVNWHDGTVHVLGKFKKERDIPMQPDAQAALVEQIEAENRLWKQNQQRLREVLAQSAERAKIPRITPHALRHTFGTRWLQAGGDIYKLSKILGHSSVAVTEAHYAHLLKEDLVAASRQVKLPIGKRTTNNVVPMRTRHHRQGEINSIK
jgi:integrase